MHISILMKKILNLYKRDEKMSRIYVMLNIVKFCNINYVCDYKHSSYCLIYISCSKVLLHMKMIEDFFNNVTIVCYKFNK